MEEVYDYVIVGCGITGAYLGYKLNMLCPNKKFLFIEKKDYIGGRLLSVDGPSNENNTKYELGGMRHFECIHPLVTSLAKELNVESSVFPEGVSSNIIELRGITMTNEKLSLDDKYNQDTNVSLFEKVNEIILKLLKSRGFTDLDYALRTKEGRRELFADPVLANSDVQSTLLNPDGLNTEEFQAYQDVVNYDNLFELSLCDAIGIIENLALGGTTTCDQKFMNGGYNLLAKKCIQQMKYTNPNVDILLNCKLTSFNEKKHPIVLNVESNNNMKKYKTKQLFLCVPYTDIQNVVNIPSTFISNINNNLIKIPLCKIFITFPRAFLNEKYDIKKGRNKCSNKLNQLWLYNDDPENYTIMLYATNNHANYWLNYLPSKEQNTFVNIEEKHEQVLNNIYPLIAKSFEISVESIPSAKQISYHYWNNGAAFWNARNKTTYNTDRDLTKTQVALFHPFENTEIVYLNNDISFNQGWVEGSLEIVDTYLQDYKYNSETNKKNNLLNSSMNLLKNLI
jgi:monoamine oxidase